MDGAILTYRGTVYPWHCDHMGHMNVMWYVGKFDEASWQLLGSVGLTAARCRRDRIGMAAHLTLEAEAFFSIVVLLNAALLSLGLPEDLYEEVVLAIASRALPVSSRQ